MQSKDVWETFAILHKNTESSLEMIVIQGLQTVRKR